MGESRASSLSEAPGVSNMLKVAGVLQKLMFCVICHVFSPEIPQYPTIQGPIHVSVPPLVSIHSLQLAVQKKVGRNLQKVFETRLTIHHVSQWGILQLKRGVNCPLRALWLLL